jgi:hypothetical protein
MAYYRGDYYRGDYYRGDLLGGLKKLGKAALGAVTGFVTGGPVGAITGAIGSLKGPHGTQLATTPTFAAPIATAGVLTGVGTAVRVGSKILGPILAGKEVVDLARGFGIGPNGKRRRSMNHLNPKALVRATRRVEGFVKKARKAVSPLGYTVVRRGSARCAPKRRCK